MPHEQRHDELEQDGSEQDDAQSMSHQAQTLVEFRALSEELIDWCEGRLARYKVPAHVRFVDDLPLTLTGKVKKYELKELWASSAEADS